MELTQAGREGEREGQLPCNKGQQSQQQTEIVNATYVLLVGALTSMAQLNASFFLYNFPTRLPLSTALLTPSLRPFCFGLCFALTGILQQNLLFYLQLKYPFCTVVALKCCTLHLFTHALVVSALLLQLFLLQLLLQLTFKYSWNVVLPELLSTSASTIIVIAMQRLLHLCCCLGVFLLPRSTLPRLTVDLPSANFRRQFRITLFASSQHHLIYFTSFSH